MKITAYSSKYCSACQGIKKELKKLEKAGFEIDIVDCDKEVSKCKGIDGTPTLILKKGNKSRKIEGFATANDIKSEFDSL